jgi:hypothetical protein
MLFMLFFIFAFVSPLYAMEKALNKELSQLALIMTREYSIPNDLIRATGQERLKQVFNQNSRELFEQYKDKVRKGMISCSDYQQPHILSLHAETIRHAAIAYGFMFVLDHNGIVTSHDLNTPPTEKSACSNNFLKVYGLNRRQSMNCISAYKNQIVFGDINGNYSYLHLSKWSGQNYCLIEGGNTEKFVIFNNWLLRHNPQNSGSYEIFELFYRSIARAYSLIRCGDTLLNVPINAALAAGDGSYFIIYEPTGSGHYTVTVNKIEAQVDEDEMIKTTRIFDAKGTSLALSQKNILFTADDTALRAYDIENGQLLGTVKNANIAPQCTTNEPLKIVCCSKYNLVIAKGKYVLNFPFNSAKFFAFLTSDPRENK